jgi:hypothetical protein
LKQSLNRISELSSKRSGKQLSTQTSYSKDASIVDQHVQGCHASIPGICKFHNRIEGEQVKFHHLKKVVVKQCQLLCS